MQKVSRNDYFGDNYSIITIEHFHILQNYATEIDVAF